MVNQGGFSVKLIHPHNKQPYKEHIHNKDDRCYCEVEPGADYLIQFEVLPTTTNIFTPENKEPTVSRLVYVQFEVDGVNLGYYETVKAGDGPQQAGYYEYTNGMENETSLRFERPRRRLHHDQDGETMATGTTTTMTNSTKEFNKVITTTRDDEAVESSSSASHSEESWAGNVKVTFSEAINVGLRQRNASWSSQKMEAVVTAFPEVGANGKVVRSGQGSWSKSLDVQQVEEEVHYEAGRHLETVTIHYCTCLGLIHRGILKKPPLWEMARLQAPCNHIMVTQRAAIKPKRIKLEPITNRDGRVIRQGEEYDYFDLTQVDEDEDEDDDEEGEDEGSKMDLTSILSGGNIPQPDGVEKLVDRFFIMNFHGKSYNSFHRDYRQKDALTQSTAQSNCNEGDPVYSKIAERHKTWEQEIHNAYGRNPSE